MGAQQGTTHSLEGLDVDILNTLVTLLGMLLTGGAVYGGIKADLRSMHLRMDRMQTEIDYNRTRLDAMWTPPAGPRHLQRVVP